MAKCDDIKDCRFTYFRGCQRDCCCNCEHKIGCRVICRKALELIEEILQEKDTDYRL